MFANFLSHIIPLKKRCEKDEQSENYQRLTDDSVVDELLVVVFD